ncbi:MAG TPA: zinc ribbon domain-containing protein [Thermoleophilaceae bacterium]
MRRAGAGDAADAQAAPDPSLVARRDRLAERFATLQLELGGLYYEMAIRDHVLPDVLGERAAQLQQIDAELAHVNALIEAGAGAAAGVCPSCHAPYARGAAFCWQCGSTLEADADVS